MAVQYLLGRAGTGKSAAVLDQIVELTRADPLGPPIFFVLPKQATFQAERELLARLGAFSRVYVVSFELLGRDILTHCGDVGLPEVTPLGRRLVLGHLLRKHKNDLKFFTRSAETPGLTAELDATFAEFDRSGVDVESLDGLLERFHADHQTDPSLLDKLSDVRLLMGAYDQFIGDDKIDPGGRMDRVLKRVGECSLLHDARVFVDSFFDFTGYELRLLTAVAAASHLTVVSLLVDPEQSDALDDLSIFHRTERTRRLLTTMLRDKGVPLMPPIILREPVRFKSPALRAIEAGLFDSDGIAEAGAVGLEKFEAVDVIGEVDAVARRIRAAVAGGLRYRQIGVLVRDLGAYQTEIIASFAEHGIPMFADVRRSATHHPLLLVTRAIMQIALRDWPHDAVMTLVKSGLAGLTDFEADDLENYVLQHRVRGRRWESPDPWPVIENAADEEDSSSPLMPANSVDDSRKKITAAVAPLLKLCRPAAGGTVREFSAAVFSVLQNLGAPDELARWIAKARKDNRLERAAEHEQVWAEFVSFFDQAVDLLGDQTLSLADFLAVVDAGMEGFDLALAPQTTDQVLVGQVDRTRTPPLEMVFVLGLNEGIFPRPAADTTLLSDRDRKLLRERLIELDPETDRQLLDERFLAYLAFTRASESLIVSRSIAGANLRESARSLFWMELTRLVPHCPLSIIPNASLSHPQQVSTPRQLLTGLMRWIRQGADPNDPVWPAMYQWVIGHAATPALRYSEEPDASNSDPLSQIRKLCGTAWPALVYDNLAGLTGEVAAGLFPVPLKATVGQLETQAACPFRHFARYGLSLGKREDPNVTTVDQSNAYHQILDGVVGDLTAGSRWSKATAAMARPFVRNHASVVGNTLRGDLLHGSARNQYLLAKIEKATGRAVAALLKSASLGSLVPESTSIRFGPGRDHPAYVVTTPAGDLVELAGRIDRVDRCGAGAEIVLVDYRMKVDAVPLDKVFHGLRLQLFTSALVLNRDSKNRTVGILEWPILTGLQNVKHPSEAVEVDEPTFLIRDQPRGVIDSGAIHVFQSDFSGGASVVVSVKRNKTGEFGDRDRTDAVSAAEMEALLEFVDRKLGQVAAGIIAGDIAVSPYMLGDETPCKWCDYRSVCRFEPGVNRYNVLPRMKRTEVLVQLTGGGSAKF